MPALVPDRERNHRPAFAQRPPKLYLNYSKGVQAQWQEDVPGHIAKGDANWPAIRADLEG